MSRMRDACIAHPPRVTVRRLTLRVSEGYMPTIRQIVDSCA